MVIPPELTLSFSTLSNHSAMSRVAQSSQSAQANSHPSRRENGSVSSTMSASTRSERGSAKHPSVGSWHQLAD